MPRPVNFSQKSAKRIASAVRKVEGTARVPFIAQRRRGQILTGVTWTPFLAKEDIPAWGVISYPYPPSTFPAASDTDGDQSFEAAKVVAMAPATYEYKWEMALKSCWVNSGADVANGEWGVASQADDKAVWALYEQSGSHAPRPGQVWGVAPGTFKLHWGLPGFRVVGPVQGAGTATQRVLVTRCLDAVHWARAYHNWEKDGTVLVYASASGVASTTYDGVNLTPAIGFRMKMPLLPDRFRDPNIVIDNFVYYRLAADPGYASGLVAAADYMDDRIGSVKLMARYDHDSVGVPQGWAVMNGTDNSAANGGSQRDLTNDALVATVAYPGIGDGLNLTNGGTQTSYKLVAIERLDNSISYE